MRVVRTLYALYAPLKLARSVGHFFNPFRRFLFANHGQVHQGILALFMLIPCTLVVQTAGGSYNRSLMNRCLCSCRAGFA